MHKRNRLPIFCLQRANFVYPNIIYVGVKTDTMTTIILETILKFIILIVKCFTVELQLSECYIRI